jgi:hypothetical protein
MHKRRRKVDKQSLQVERRSAAELPISYKRYLLKDIIRSKIKNSFFPPFSLVLVIRLTIIRRAFQFVYKPGRASAERILARNYVDADEYRIYETSRV